MQGVERLLLQIQVTKIFNSLTRGLSVEIMPSHLPPEDLNPGHSLGEAIGIETGVKLRIEPLGPKKKMWGEDRTLGAQFRVIFQLVFQSVSDATIADPSWRGPFSRQFCTKDPPLAIFKLIRYSADNENKGLSRDEAGEQRLQTLSLRRYTTLIYSTPIKSRLNKDGALNPFFL